ncbi:MAG TPA: creatininase family protein [Candidatus Polarisedimenticolia bacterium]|nr:creatininase family protein [Candidatus Polarisedimenticolia bacterium]
MPGDDRRWELAARSWTEIAAALSPGSKVVALLPIGSTEPHGPHLPLETDVIISAEAAVRAAGRLRERGIEAFVLPALPYTVTEYSRDFAGAIGISAATLEAALGEVAEAALSHGFCLVCLVNSHLEPGHLEVLRRVSARLSPPGGRPVIFPDKTSRRWAATLTDEFRSGACHAGRYETSLVMAARPGLVDEPARRALAANPVSIGRKIKEGARSFLEAGGDQAYFGDPASATAEEGRASFEALAAMVETAVLEALER